jgi:membrane dipeptidase
MGAPVLFDGQLVRVGDPGLLRASGLDALVVTAADWHAGFTEACEQIGAWWDRFADNPGEWFPILTPADLDVVGEDDRVGVVLALQNAELLEDRLERLWALQRLGIRIIQPTYNTATLVADGCLEERDAGLTRFGRGFVRECNRLGIAVDLSHVGDRSALDIAEASESPVVITHANLRRIAPSPRNKEDELVRAVAAGGGVAGVTVYGPACWRGTDQKPTLDDFAAQVEAMLELVGEDAVAVGSDHYVPAPDDLEHLTQVLERTVARYSGIVGRYVERFGNTLQSRYVDGFETIDGWSGIRSELAGRLGLGDGVLDKLLGGNWTRVLAQVMDASRNLADAVPTSKA